MGFGFSITLSIERNKAYKVRLWQCECTIMYYMHAILLYIIMCYTIVFLGLGRSTWLSLRWFIAGTVEESRCIIFQPEPYKMPSTTLSRPISSSRSTHFLIGMSYLKALVVHIDIQVLPPHSVPCSSAQVALNGHDSKAFQISHHRMHWNTGSLNTIFDISFPSSYKMFFPELTLSFAFLFHKTKSPSSKYWF